MSSSIGTGTHESNASSPPRVIYIIRHAEKPATASELGSAPACPAIETKPPTFGVTASGQMLSPDPQKNPSLTPRGWERAGALAVLFGRIARDLSSGLDVPDYIFASKYDRNNENDTGLHRPWETILPLAELLSLPIQADYSASDGGPAMDAALKLNGTVLFCWEHHNIYQAPTSPKQPPGGLVGQLSSRGLISNPGALPPRWDGSRFDLIWCFELSGGKYFFSQIPQLLLACDSSDAVLA